MPKRNVTIEKNEFAAVMARVRAAAAESVREITLDLERESVALAPIEKGELRESAATEFSENGLVGVVSFNTPYAAAQHERTDQAHPGGGQAKYLETPLVRNRDRYQKQMADAINKVLQ